jgi:hypothetical protein
MFHAFYVDLRSVHRSGVIVSTSMRTSTELSGPPAQKHCNCRDDRRLIHRELPETGMRAWLHSFSVEKLVPLMNLCLPISGEYIQAAAAAKPSESTFVHRLPELNVGTLKR